MQPEEEEEGEECCAAPCCARSACRAVQRTECCDGPLATSSSAGVGLGERSAKAEPR